jgi:hypothetical protein
MKKKPRFRDVVPKQFNPADNNGHLLNQQLLDWMSFDEQRRQLFAVVNERHGGRLTFPSRDAAARECGCEGYETPRKPLNAGHRPVTLVTGRDEIVRILLDEKREYSSRVYAELGGGNFMLALDPKATPVHEEQRQVFRDCFPDRLDVLQQLGYAACQSASVLAFRAPDFDLASFAEQAALRCCQLLMGYAMRDHPLLELSLRAAYKALVYQVHGRHFVTDPTAIPEAKELVGKLLTRTGALIDAYAGTDKDDDELKGCDDPTRPSDLTPVLKRLARLPGNLNSEQRAIIAVGSAIGMVGNVQAAVCIAVRGVYAQAEARTAARRAAESDRDEVSAELDLLLRGRKLALNEDGDRPTRQFAPWKALIADQLRANPPIPYLPRLKVDENGRMVEELLLALGGGTAGYTGLPPGADDPLVWGFPWTPPNAGAGVATTWTLPATAPHCCAGQALAWPLIVEVVREVMRLPNLAQQLNPADGKVMGLEKQRGFACSSYPFTHRRDRWRAQSSLNVAMRIKAPIKDNVDRVRDVIRSGAPRIERLLRESRHVHFAWFEIIETETVLVLHTVYDGPFGAYLQHFALQAGDLFDVLFSFIEDPPPMPVHKFPDEFAAHLLRYNRPPAMGYFFSAYPGCEVAGILRNEGCGP